MSIEYTQCYSDISFPLHSSLAMLGQGQILFFQGLRDQEVVCSPPTYRIPQCGVPPTLQWSPSFRGHGKTTAWTLLPECQVHHVWAGPEMHIWEIRISKIFPVWCTLNIPALGEALPALQIIHQLLCSPRCQQVMADPSVALRLTQTPPSRWVEYLLWFVVRRFHVEPDQSPSPMEPILLLSCFSCPASLTPFSSEPLPTIT